MEAQTAGTASEVLRARGLELGQIHAEVVRRSATDAAAPGGEAAKEALSTLGIDVAEIRRRADETFGPGAFQYPRPAYSLPVKKRRTGVEVLTILGVEPDTLRRSVLERTA